ncbi:MAG TPA: nickel-dependent lactate racemase [Syntrophomonadaceae bacterium]|nr:nickel-dependent lactate racemase [Syntrophomonadaceae bacterium]
MLIEFPYDDMPQLEIPDKNLLGVYSPQHSRAEVSEIDLIHQGLSKPIGSLPIHERVRAGDQVLIITDDNTRLTPLHLVVPAIIEELKKAGVPDANIRIMIGLGTHRLMTEEEIQQKFGSVYGKYQIINHNWRDHSSMVNMGYTKQGTPIVVNRMVVESDFVIGVGHIVPHRVAGYSGGAKIVQPGVCGAETTGLTHWVSAKYRGDEILGAAKNPVRDEMNEVARLVGLNMIVNAIQGADGSLVALVAGDPEKAHEAGCQIARRVYGVKIPRKAPIIVVDSYPADIEMWQAAKGVYSAGPALADGGTVILVTTCPEGVARQHPEIEEYGYQPYEKVQALVDSGQITDLAVAAHMVHVGEVILDKGHGILVSKYIDDETAVKLGFTPAPTPQAALEMAFQRHGKDAEVLVLQHGGEILPVVASDC